MPDQPPPGAEPPPWVAPGDTPTAFPPAAPPVPSGYGAPGYGPPGYGPPGYGHHGYPVPAYKPGVVALRPLQLGDIYDGALKTIRRNPAAMVGLAALVSTAFLVLPALLSLLLAATGNMRLGGSPASPSVLGAGFADAAPALATGAASIMGWLATVVLNGMIVQVVAQAVVGRKSTIGEAWVAARGRLLPLLGLTLLNGVVLVAMFAVPAALGVLLWATVGHAAGILVGVLLGIITLVLAIFVQVRCFQLAAPALVLERVGVLAAVRRSVALTRAQFWRLFGIMLLTGVIVGMVGNIVAIPFGLVGALGAGLVSQGAAGALFLVFSQYLSQILVAVVTRPFSAGVVALQYVDQRIRKEGFDVALMAAAAETAQPAPGIA